MMFAKGRWKRQGYDVSQQHQKSLVRICSKKQTKKQTLTLCLCEKVKRLLQAPGIDISKNDDRKLSMTETSQGLFVCRKKQKTIGIGVTNMEENSQLNHIGEHIASEAIQTGESLSNSSRCTLPDVVEPNQNKTMNVNCVEDSPTGLTLTSPSSGMTMSESQDLSTFSITMSWREITQGDDLYSQNMPVVVSQETPLPADSTGDVIEYIMKELQGISRIQAEIAELRQHLSLIKGSVEEVSTCVDTVLSEIEGLQVGFSSPIQSTQVVQVVESHKDSQAEEPLLYFYGIPEEDDENTIEVVSTFLSEHHYFNGTQCSLYIKEAHRLGTYNTKLIPRPTVVKLAHIKHRDFILQNSILLRSSGVRISQFEEGCLLSAQNSLRTDSVSLLKHGLRENRWSSLSLDKGIVRTDGVDAELQTESYCIRYQNTCMLAKKCSSSTEREDPRANITQVIDGSCHEQSVETSVSHLCIRVDSQDSKKNRNFTGLNASIEQNGRSPKLLNRTSHLSSSCEIDETGIAIKRSCSTVDEQKAEDAEEDKELVPCDSKIQFRSSEKINLIIKDQSGSFTSLSFDDTVGKLADGLGTETLKEVVHIEMDSQEPSDHVFRDFLDQPNENIDLGDIKFYANKLGKALSHFRSALKLAFNKLETSAILNPEPVMGSKETGFQMESYEGMQKLGKGMHSGSNGHFPASLPPSDSQNWIMDTLKLAIPATPKAEQHFVLTRDPSLPCESPFSPALSGSDAETYVDQNLSSPLPRTDTTSGLGGTPEGRPLLTLEQVCTETIYLNRCINNFKNVLREKRKMQRKLLKDIVQETFWTSAEEMISEGCRGELQASKSSPDPQPKKVLDKWREPERY